MPHKETPEATLQRVRETLWETHGQGYSQLDICEAYRIERNKQEALSESEVDSRVCQKLRKAYLSDSEIRTGAFDDSYIIGRYTDEWSLMMDTAKIIQDHFTNLNK